VGRHLWTGVETAISTRGLRESRNRVVPGTRRTLRDFLSVVRARCATSGSGENGQTVGEIGKGSKVANLRSEEQKKM